MCGFGGGDWHAGVNLVRTQQGVHLWPALIPPTSPEIHTARMHSAGPTPLTRCRAADRDPCKALEAVAFAATATSVMWRDTLVLATLLPAATDASFNRNKRH